MRARKYINNIFQCNYTMIKKLFDSDMLYKIKFVHSLYVKGCNYARERNHFENSVWRIIFFICLILYYLWAEINTLQNQQWTSYTAVSNYFRSWHLPNKTNVLCNLFADTYRPRSVPSYIVAHRKRVARFLSRAHIYHLPNDNCLFRWQGRESHYRSVSRVK